MICGSGGSKSRLAKAAGAEPAGQMRDEKLHAVVARSKFRSQNVQNTSRSEHFWKLRCRKSARRCGAKQISKSKCTKHFTIGTLLEVEMSKKRTPLWREAHFEVKMYKARQLRTLLEVVMSKKCTPLWHEAHFEVNMCKTVHIWTTLEVGMSKKCTPLCCEAHFQVKMLKHHMLESFLDVQMSFRAAGARDCAPCQKWAKLEGFCSSFKNDVRRGTYAEDMADAFRMAGAVQETCSSELLGGPGADFLRRVAFWRIRPSVLGRWFCVTRAALRMTWHHNGITFSWQAQHFRQMEWKNRKTHWHEAVSSALNFPFWKDVSQFLMLSILKNEEASQNCCVFDVVKCKNWGSLAELLRFWCCQVQKLRKSGRIASLFKLAGRQTDGQTDR